MSENDPSSAPGERDSAPFTQAAPAIGTISCDDYPFWGYLDLAVFFLAALLSVAVVNLGMGVFNVRASRQIFVMLPAQCLLYVLLFLALYAILSRHHGQRFWLSLRWVRTRFGPARSILYGFTLAFAVIFLGIALRTPDIQTPMKELLSDRTSVLLIAGFAITLGPLCEELVFRGFMQPVLVRSFGAATGIVLTAIPFGLLHLPEYAWSWRHGLLITIAGIGFGWMRHVSGSTRASAIMHSAYNFIPFVAMFSQKGSIPRAW